MEIQFKRLDGEFTLRENVNLIEITIRDEKNNLNVFYLGKTEVNIIVEKLTKYLEK